MVGQEDQPPEKSVKEIQHGDDEEMAQATHLSRDINKRKWHNGLQDDSRALEDEPSDGPP
jgi:hypothetical protein